MGDNGYKKAKIFNIIWNMLIFEEMNMFRMQAIKKGTYKKSPHFFPVVFLGSIRFLPSAFIGRLYLVLKENKD
jgi:hypothetical protein